MTIAVDFDGVIHRYGHGWGTGAIYDKPLEGAFEALDLLMSKDAVFVHTARRPASVARWIEQTTYYTIECTTWLPRTWYGRRKRFWNQRGILLVTDRKYPATDYIDDRAVRFTTWPETLKQIKVVTL